MLAARRTLEGGQADERRVHEAVGTALEVIYPIGHRRRRAEGIPVLLQKFKNNVETQFAAEQLQRVLAACADRVSLEAMGVDEFIELWVKQ